MGVDINEIIAGIKEEQEQLKAKKAQIKQLIHSLESKLQTGEEKSYRKISQHLQGEIIKSLVTAHNLDIQLSSTILKSYDQLFKIAEKQTSSGEITGDLMQQLISKISQDIKIQVKE